jgi:two-component system, OmpR family, phosphate regulon sensor histidine kinase PhoR
MTGNTHKKSTGSRAGLSRTRLRGSAILMTIAILGITGFQVYWLKNNYDREKQTLDIKTGAAFRETVERVQAGKLRLERIMINVDSANVTAPAIPGNNLRPFRPARRIKNGTPGEKEITVMRLIQDKLRDSLLKDTSGKRPFFIALKDDSLGKPFRDSLVKLRGSINTIRISHTFDSLSEMISEVQVNKRPGSGGGIVTVGYGKPPAARDSIIIKGRTNIERLPDIPIPAGPREGWTGRHGDGNAVFQFLYNVDSVWAKDSATVKEITEAYDKRLIKENINIGFKINRVDGLIKDTLHTVTIGFSTPIGFQLSLHNSFNYMFDKLKLPILFSLLLVGITIASFVLLYRNMLKQKRLAELKNEFISNITHELKTPIATVGVAIEALKSFNAMDDPKRTQEYLSISQNELQRLNLLVDKVLKLSMFEKKEIDLKYELINLKDVVDEVTASMRLQIEKYRASVTTNVEGDCTLQGDRLHLLSVVFNLLDNALKYGGDAPVIQISLEEKENSIEMTIADNGIGISPEYKDKVFEKFFRVPHGDTHNAKGYGLGLSYTAHVIKKHRGTIRLATEPGKGATFIITLPKQNT